MKRLAGAGLLSFLDLVCCGLGAGLLLLLASVRDDPPPDERLDGCLVVRARLEGGESRVPAEVGIEYRAPGADRWRRGAVGADSAFSLPSGPDSGGEALLAVVEPEAGQWRFRPYLVDFPKRTATTRGPGGAIATTVSMRAYGRHAAGSREAESLPMPLPGDFGQELRVTVNRTPN